MARLNCKCGEVLSNSLVPNDIELTVYTDKEWDSIFIDEIIEYDKIPLPTYNVWRRPNCKRIYVFEDMNRKAIYVYKLEEDE